MTATVKRRISQGTYTPTATIVANLDSVTTYSATYSRIGDIVTVAGVLTVDATAAAQSQVGLSLPFSSNFAAITQLAGSGAIIGTTSVYIVGNATSDRADLYWTAAGTTAINLSYIFQYRVI